MKKIELAILTGLVLAIFLTQFTAFANSCNTVREDTLRLHVLANSNSENDQNLKLAVRDELLLKYGDCFANSTSLEDAKNTASGLLYAMEYSAREVIKAHGYDYTVNIALERMFFDSKFYEGFTLPAGDYDALRVEIGTATGENWFCVLYPALCIPAATQDEGIAVYSDTQKEAVESKFEVKFAVLEWFDDAFSNDDTTVISAEVSAKNSNLPSDKNHNTDESHLETAKN